MNSYKTIDWTTLKQVNSLEQNKERYVVQENELHAEFTRRFSDFRDLKNEFMTVSASFSISANDAPTEVQLEIIDLQADPRHAFNFRTDKITNFYSFLDEHSFYKLRFVSNDTTSLRSWDSSFGRTKWCLPNRAMLCYSPPLFKQG